MIFFNIKHKCNFTNTNVFVQYYNDPSAGSPTDTLLRLLLPLNGAVWGNSSSLITTTPYTSLSHSIGNSDGRCVQRAGT